MSVQASPKRFGTRPQDAPAVQLRTGINFRLLTAAIAVAAPLSVPAVVHAQSNSVDVKKEKELKPVVVEGKADAQQGKDAIQATKSSIGKGNQALRDIPQSVTVVTEKLIAERNLDTVKDVLHNTAGVTFLAAEGGEEDIRLRGFSLAATGDIYLDGMRDAAFYDRDTFNHDRIDVLRGSASMLFGRGSTGGVVNQVSKAPHGTPDRTATLTLGNFAYRRFVADINQPLTADAAVRVALMRTKADNNGAGSRIDKEGAAISAVAGNGHRHEWQGNLYYINNNNGVNYGLPWIRPNATDTSAANTLIPGLKPEAYYGLASDYNAGKAFIATAVHTWRFGQKSELKTQVRRGAYERDLRPSTVRFAAVGTLPTNNRVPVDISTLGASTVLSRGTPLRIQNLDTLQVQSDLSYHFRLWGLDHHVLAGIDAASDTREVFAGRSALQGGVTIIKPTTLIGTPNDGASVDETSRVLRRANDFDAAAQGVYVQNLVAITPKTKLLGGLRYDRLKGVYNLTTLPNNSPTPETTIQYRQTVGEWSHRVGALYQPSDRYSFHASYGTSFNTSGDTYSYNPLSANTPPESSENLELGGRAELAAKQLSLRFAIFRSVKKNERNTDPDTAATRLLLSGRRHTAGLEFDLAGRITPDWEAFVSYAWMPVARVDEAATTATTVGNRVGDRPGLSPKHSGAIWTTYAINRTWRTGGGINFGSRQSPADVTAPAWEAPAYVTADLFAEYRYSDAYRVKVNVSNVANKLYADALYRGHYIPGSGRLIQATLSAAF